MRTLTLAPKDTAILSSIFLKKTNKKEFNSKQTHMDRAWIEINSTNLRHNVKALSEVLSDGCELMAVVKANAYGHGDVEVATNLNQLGVKSFAVATIDEAIHLRTHGIKGNILILGYTSPKRAREMLCYNLMQTITDYDHAKQLNAFGKLIQVHIKIDTGMHRLGERCNNTIEIDKILRCENLKVCGIFTHLCAADSTKADDTEFTINQFHSFYALLHRLEKLGHTLPKIHIQSSYGVLNYPELQCDYVRIGDALYGALSSPDNKTRLQIDLQPVLALKARIVLVRTICVGESVSYGRQFIAQRETRVAILPIGFADGLPRSLSCGVGYVLIHGCFAPTIGRICMDHLMVDVTDIPGARKNDIVTLIGCDGSEKITAQHLAKNAGTIASELLSRLGNRLERVIL
ncbi:serine racemase VanT catalytic subunit [Clostridium sp. CF012]|uniref:serine racemase VanT catalytic subunit n=1 Tax=Clostridium sp. CF012 TaxID=2843319 RepID=UPI001C0BEE76|nr:serine racemase VanT catalytic subunit [Clostridium sp. CF012]MBU3145513.1 serine racemase VanT catalytic subunit [Clostridium sp. CF012]